MTGTRCILSRFLRQANSRPLKAWREDDGSWIVSAGHPGELQAGFELDPSNWDPISLPGLLERYPALGVVRDVVGDAIEWDPIRDEYVERAATFACAVSRWVFEPDCGPWSARREEPVNDRDSGWCFLAGVTKERDVGYGDLAENWRHISLADLIEQFPMTAELFKEPVGSEFEWEPAVERFRLTYSL